MNKKKKTKKEKKKEKTTTVDKKKKKRVGKCGPMPFHCSITCGRSFSVKCDRGRKL